MKRFLRFLSFFLALLIMMNVSAVPALAETITLKSGAHLPDNVLVGQSYNLKVPGRSKIVFSSSNDKVATIGKTTGRLQPVERGAVKITAKDGITGNAVAKTTLTVLKRAKEIIPIVTNVELKVDDTFSLPVSLVPADSTDVVRYISSDKNVVTVGFTHGNLTGISEGTAVITVVSKKDKSVSNNDPSNRVAYINVTVKKGDKEEKKEEKKEIPFSFVDAAWGGYDMIVFVCHAPWTFQITLPYMIMTDLTDGTNVPLRYVQVLCNDILFYLNNGIRYGYIVAENTLKEGHRYSLKYYQGGQAQMNLHSEINFQAKSGDHSFQVLPVTARVGEPTKLYLYEFLGIRLEKYALTQLPDQYTVSFEGVIPDADGTICFNDITDECLVTIAWTVDSNVFKSVYKVSAMAAEEPEEELTPEEASPAAPAPAARRRLECALNKLGLSLDNLTGVETKSANIKIRLYDDNGQLISFRQSENNDPQNSGNRTSLVTPFFLNSAINGETVNTLVSSTSALQAPQDSTIIPAVATAVTQKKAPVLQSSSSAEGAAEEFGDLSKLEVVLCSGNIDVSSVCSLELDSDGAAILNFTVNKDTPPGSQHDAGILRRVVRLCDPGDHKISHRSRDRSGSADRKRKADTRRDTQSVHIQRDLSGC